MNRYLLALSTLFFFLGQDILAQEKIEMLRKSAEQKGVVTSGNNPTAIGSNKAANTKPKDSLGFEHRDDLKDSINISYKYLDSIRSNSLDFSINDFDKYFSIPSSYQYLGNNGAAAYSLIFTPNLKPGWDAGFHAYDVYRYKLEDTRFYKTTRPFTQMNYQLASGKEQMIKIFHTQNPRPNWNFGFDYRLISAPGFFVTQNTNHNSYRLFNNYQGKKKRYTAQFILMGNTIRASENGGIRNDSLLLDPHNKKRFSIPVQLGGASLFQPNPFKSSISTGNIYRDFNFFLRQSYDIGKRDSVEINDSTTEYLFYPKLRLQHSFTYSTYSYNFKDDKADSVIYQNWYDTVFNKATVAFSVKEKWTVLSNDFSLIQFPDTKNAAQFFLAGITHQRLAAVFNASDTINREKTYYNILVHAEYRNKTRNKLWDVLAKGELYLNGLNSGDYSAQLSLGRVLNKRLGDLRLFFSNVNRTPSFVFDNSSTFNFHNTNPFKKENITRFGALASNPYFNLGFTNYLITNYTYFTGFYKTAQSSKLINLLQLSASKKIKLNAKWNWYTEWVIQQTDGSAPVKVPLLFTRNRLAFEGVFYKNLNLSTGIEVRYYTPYEAYNYSPVMGQFTPQDSFKLKNLPDISAFFHFRIKSFTGYIRAENLNTVSFANGFGFVNNNFAAAHYPTQGLMIRFGIKWGFVN